MAKRMRLPNGFGQISEIKGRPLRNRFRVMVTTGWKDGKPDRMSLGYYKTYNEAYSALVEYHKSPYDKSAQTTVGELYDMWSKEYYPRLKTYYNYTAAWKRCILIKDVKLCDVTRPMLKDVIEAPMPSSTHSSVKMLLTLMFDHALGLGMVKENPVKGLPINIERKEIVHHTRFSNDEIKLIEEKGGIIADMIIFGCYSGMRPGEICKIKKSDVDMADWTLVGGSKTKAGRDRVVPIHSKVRSIVSHYMEMGGSEYLFGLKYASYNNFFSILMSDLDLGEGHKPHDTRVTFVSKAKEAGCDEYIIKKVIGHHIDDMTERLYTKRSTKDLSSEVEKIV